MGSAPPPPLLSKSTAPKSVISIFDARIVSLNGGFGYDNGPKMSVLDFTDNILNIFANIRKLIKKYLEVIFLRKI